MAVSNDCNPSTVRLFQDSALLIFDETLTDTVGDGVEGRRGSDSGICMEGVSRCGPPQYTHPPLPFRTAAFWDYSPSTVTQPGAVGLGLNDVRHTSTSQKRSSASISLFSFALISSCFSKSHTSMFPSSFPMKMTAGLDRDQHPTVPLFTAQDTWMMGPC
ncbi:hypothetical protein JZ751_024801 [Albula glossodonta]|uniref:Uncharacterized protein n=1 Tax=Albula glossodonta TaxID=121402 RepID=A0A8T2PLQ2_9TELE|nr:hypothetical protein JZ751_024801 [Albula glossodonta]